MCVFWMDYHFRTHLIKTNISAWMMMINPRLKCCQQSGRLEVFLDMTEYKHGIENLDQVRECWVWILFIAQGDISKDFLNKTDMFFICFGSRTWSVGRHQNTDHSFIQSHTVWRCAAIRAVWLHPVSVPVLAMIN